jgi:hypothetical protein
MKSTYDDIIRQVLGTPDPNARFIPGPGVPPPEKAPPNILGSQYDNLPAQTTGPLDWWLNPQNTIEPSGAVDKALNAMAEEYMRKNSK